MSLLSNKSKDNKGTWHKVSDLVAGLEIARPRADFDGSIEPSERSGDIVWDEIISITPVGREQVYDIEVEGTHNFVGNDIFAHNTYVIKSGDLTADAPPEILTAGNTGVDLASLATYALSEEQKLAAKVNADITAMVSLEARVAKIESGAIASGGSLTSTSSGSLTSSLSSALSDLGVIIQRGIAQFNTLVFRQLVASKDADGTSSAGSVSILTGNTVAQVTNSLVLPSTKVFVTFNSQITGSWWVSDKTNGGFRVVLSAPQTTDVSFDYFLVQTEGQLATSTPDGGFGSQTSNASSESLTSSDHTSPVITLLGDNPAHVSVGGTFTDPGVSVSDNVDGTDPVITYINGVQAEVNAGTIDTSKQTTYIITYTAVDKAGNNATTVTRSVIVGDPDADAGESQTSSAPADTTPPVVTLVGDAAMQLDVGGSFTDPGATATDEVDGDLTAKIVETGSVDTATAGLYTLTYTATDVAGNAGSASRVVTIVATTTSQ